MYIRVTVVPKAKKETIEKVGENAFAISVKEPAERNLANKRVIKLLSHHFETKNIRLVSGHHSPRKIFSVE